MRGGKPNYVERMLVNLGYGSTVSRVSWRFPHLDYALRRMLAGADQDWARCHHAPPVAIQRHIIDCVRWDQSWRAALLGWPQTVSGVSNIISQPASSHCSMPIRATVHTHALKIENRENSISDSALGRGCVSYILQVGPRTSDGRSSVVHTCTVHGTVPCTVLRVRCTATG